MSGILNALLGASATGYGGQRGAVSGGHVLFLSDGSISYSQYVSGIHSWYNPNASGLGSAYYIRCIKSAGINFSGIVNNTWTSLVSGVDIGATGGVGAVIGTWEIAATPGGAVIAGGSITVNNAI